MRFDENGEYKARRLGDCLPICGVCVACCPHPGDRTVMEEDLKQEFSLYGGDLRQRPETGFYLKLYQGYSEEDGHRSRGASGGLAIWFMEKLLIAGEVDKVLCVRGTTDPNKMFEYFEADSSEALRRSAGSAYYPVELSGMLRHVLQSRCRVAVVGVPCFLRALCLAEGSVKKMGKRISYRVGLVCSRLPSTKYLDCFIEYLGLQRDDVLSVRFRDKSLYPSSYRGLGITTKDGRLFRPNNRADYFWTTGHVSPTACMFCDDVFAETAHVTFMDAWLPEYQGEHLGRSIVLCRDARCAGVFERAIGAGMSLIEELPVERVIESQRARIRNKRQGLSYRIQLARRWGIPFPTRKLAPGGFLSWGEKARTIITFYRQQKAHGCQIPVLKRIIPACLMRIDDLITCMKKRRSDFLYGKQLKSCSYVDTSGQTEGPMGPKAA
jgi:coenzyme F420-reducing hydrogenase beta subunit